MDYERLGVFYLGKQHDLATGQTGDEVLYDARDLTTHAVCVGMTGSGKTGLCLALLEEALLDGVPVIAIDPKGDLGNLALTFPDLAPADFAPWLDPAAAQRDGLTPEALAAKTAGKWKDGLAAWGQGPERIGRLRAAGDVVIYTPGSEAGLPLSILRSFAAPPASLQEDADAWRDQIEAAVSGLLALVGVTADPLRSREHVLLSQLLDRQWRAGVNVDLASLIQLTVKPPFDRVGAFDLEAFFPAKERHELALAFNTLLASPAFAPWTAGEPLDIARLLHGPDGRPRISILSIAHLGDAERMFFVTLLLQQVLSWVRAQPGSTSLRAILFMDELFGFLPPTAAPPSKKPLLTLLKQARAFGLGLVLATQNPVDLDYKALANCGTWLLGRMQTERDKARVVEGLESASATAGGGLDRAALDATLSALTSRVFLLHDVHRGAPVVMQSRWVMSYLAGPLSRPQIQRLTRVRAALAPASTGASAVPSATAVTTAPAASSPAPSASAAPAGPRPVAPAGLAEQFTGTGAMKPVLVAHAKAHYVSAKDDVDVWQDVIAVAGLDPDKAGDLWEGAERATAADLPGHQPEAPAGASFASLPRALDAKAVGKLDDGVAAWIYRTCTLTLWRAKALDLVSTPGEGEEAFRGRVAIAARAARDQAIDKLRAKYQPKVDKLEDKLRTAEQRLSKEQAEASAQSTTSAISIGASVLGALFGKRGRGTVTGAASAARSVNAAAKQKADVARASDARAAIAADLAELEAEVKAEIAELEAAPPPVVETLELSPRKADTSVSRLALWWIGHGPPHP